MSKLIPIISGLTGTAIIGSVGTYLLLTQNTKTFREVFIHSLISSDEKGNSIFREKLKRLKNHDIKSDNAKLKEAKTKATGSGDEGLNELKIACKEIYDSKFDNRNSNIFKDFKTFCSKNIKDEITESKWALSETSFQWKNKHEKLKSQKSTLVPSLSEIANKQTMAMKIWKPDAKLLKIHCLKVRKTRLLKMPMIFVLNNESIN